MIVRDPTKRLSLEEIVSHPWMKSKRICYAGFIDGKVLNECEISESKWNIPKEEGVDSSLFAKLASEQNPIDSETSRLECLMRLL